ncbi:MAG: hypothetical protein AW07_03767 [Candidatus Accumulibacter sp. SK-11]|nr:MAG: hypothetical protein AW07_03767 [Candidatus Accumulibacter sp. SK-11]
MWAISVARIELKPLPVVFMLRRLKNRVRCAFVVASLSIRLFLKTYS